MVIVPILPISINNDGNTNTTFANIFVHLFQCQKVSNESKLQMEVNKRRIKRGRENRSTPTTELPNNEANGEQSNENLANSQENENSLGTVGSIARRLKFTTK